MLKELGLTISRGIVHDFFDLITAVNVDPAMEQLPLKPALFQKP